VVGDSRGDWIILRQSACGSFSLYPGSPGNFLLAKALTEKKEKNFSNNPNFQGETYTTLSKLFLENSRDFSMYSSCCVCLF